MSGSVTRSGDGWQYVIDAGLDADGRRRQHRRRGFATRKLAQAAMAEAQNAALHGELVSCGRQTVAESVEQRLAAVVASLEPAGRGGRPLANTTVRLVHGVVRRSLNDAVL